MYLFNPSLCILKAKVLFNLFFSFLDTGWLDHLIASQVKGKKPDTMVAVMCASVLIADSAIQDAYNNFYNSLEK